MGDVFADADAYEAYMGRWSRLVAPVFVAWLGAPAGLRWLDVGCGTGSLTAALIAGATPASVLAVDRSEAFVAAARRAALDLRVSVEVAAADALPVPDRSLDAAVSGLVLNFLPDAPAAVREQLRVVVPGGRVAAFVWDYAEGMEPLRHFWDAAASVDPGRADLDEGA
ncbi:methyltransferase domain-containing protein, partial [Actinotalea sp.]|uniref:class I SAM-dependent methyltransferase n=1 Tax=Actinotalea sp. TaxID=1872145 RepID=UPI002C57601E